MRTVAETDRLKLSVERAGTDLTIIIQSKDGPGSTSVVRLTPKQALALIQALRSEMASGITPPGRCPNCGAFAHSTMGHDGEKLTSALKCAQCGYQERLK